MLLIMKFFEILEAFFIVKVTHSFNITFFFHQENHESSELLEESNETSGRENL